MRSGPETVIVAANARHPKRTQSATPSTSTLTAGGPAISVTFTNAAGSKSTSALTTSLVGAGFEITTNGCAGLALGPSKSCQMSVRYPGPAPVTTATATLTVQSKKPAAIASATLTVNGGRPTAADDSFQTDENTTLTVVTPGVLANDSDPQGTPLSAVPATGPAHGVLTLNANGSFTYAPAAGYFGPDSFSYTASDGALASLPATVAITIVRVNVAPVANGDNYTATFDGVVEVGAPDGVLANDSDADGDTLTAALVSGPSHGSLTLDSDGGFRYTAEAGFSGLDSFRYKANDGSGDSAVVTVSLTVGQFADISVRIELEPDSDSDFLRLYVTNHGPHAATVTAGIIVTCADGNQPSEEATQDVEPDGVERAFTVARCNDNPRIEVISAAAEVISSNLPDPVTGNNIDVLFV